MVIATYSKPEDAHLAVSLLEGNGIQAYVRDGNTVSLHWLYSNAIGGVKVEVADADAESALEILNLPAEPATDSLLQCPHCGSGKVRLREMTLFSAICLSLGFLLPLKSRRADCFECEQSFRLEALRKRKS